MGIRTIGTLLPRRESWQKIPYRLEARDQRRAIVPLIPRAPRRA